MADCINGFGVPKDAALQKNALIINGVKPATSVTFAAAVPGAANEATLKFTVRDGDDAAETTPVLVDVWLSDVATGVGLTATTASGAVTNVTNGGTVFAALTAKKALVVQTLADGTFNLTVTDTAKTQFYVCVALKNTGQVFIQRLLTASYA
jgi:hypothetical protein